MIAAHILLIEDETEIADAVIFALNRAGMSAHHALTAADGLAWLVQGQADLLLLDVGLPDQNGFDVLKTVRKTSELPVIMLTAQHEEIDRIVGLELGADDYIGKPFSPRELIARIKAVLKRTHPSAPAGLSGDFQFDPVSQQIRYQNRLLPLTLAELRIFALMLSHPEQVFSREQLLTAAFSADHPSDARTVDTHIKTLRHKLREQAALEEVIVTHRALGYSFHPPKDSPR